MKKVLIFTASIGGGHNEAASCLEKEFKKHGFIVKKLDALLEINKTLDAFIIGSCKVLVNNFPKLYGSLYSISNKEKSNKLITHSFSRISREKIYDIILRENPDLIISTHAFMVGVIGSLKERGLINIPFISIVTDYEAHRTYIDKNVDAYIAGSDYTSRTLMKQGISRDKIYSYGIPIKEEFLRRFKPIHLKSTSFQILLMAGSLGLKGMKKVLRNIVQMEGDYNIVTICGKNRKLQASIEKEYMELIESNKLTVYGFTNNIPFIMENSDIIITKPGGLTISESIAKQLPIIIPYYIPGQEKENLEFLLREGLAIYVPEVDSIKGLLESIMKEPEILNIMKKNMEERYNKSCLDNIIYLSENLIENCNYRMELGYGS
ncbi:glycosyltransferase [Tissierella praeacuta]|uniref:MGDG synthase family glycosyltransferase n=1 Tax=Tissierella praeacuta TaxID=43131 RepID=UPI0033428461